MISTLDHIYMGMYKRLRLRIGFLLNEIISLLKKSEGKVSVIENNGKNVIEAISRADVVVATRFHAMVLGALFEKKQIIYSYNNKTTQFAKTYGFKTYEVTGSSLEKQPFLTKFDIDIEFFH